MPRVQHDKQVVHDFWDDASCGEALYLGESDEDGYRRQAEQRYALEPYIIEFADFPTVQDRRVLEIGVGLGADHQRFAEHGAILNGVDLTERAIEHTRSRFQLLGLRSELQVADAEALPFDDDDFDLVYSWGVIHHSPNTAQAVREIHRILQPGGIAKVMIYHKHSFVGYMLWLRYGLLGLRPFTSLDAIYDRHLESPGTKAYSRSDARRLFDAFSKVQVETLLTHGDLLTSAAGQRHDGRLLRLMRAVWPRRIIHRFFPRSGLFMLITAEK